MAIRQIRVMGDDVLNKVCKPVKEVTPRISQLIDDMLETMYADNGVGLAGPQVGVLRRLCVIDVGEGPLVLINPEILEREGEQTGDEGCLSYPGMVAEVTRPDHVVVRAFDRNMKEYTLTGDHLLARAICHELDHLDGIMYPERANGPVRSVGAEEDEEQI